VKSKKTAKGSFIRSRRDGGEESAAKISWEAKKGETACLVTRAGEGGKEKKAEQVRGAQTPSTRGGENAKGASGTRKERPPLAEGGEHHERVGKHLRKLIEKEELRQTHVRYADARASAASALRRKGGVLPSGKQKQSRNQARNGVQEKHEGTRAL